MATRRPAGTRVETIHCEFCGEDYAATYKRCPFCDGKPIPEDEDMERSPRGYSNTRGGGYGGGPPVMKIVGTVISLAVIVAAILIVVTTIKPFIDKGKTPPIDPNASPSFAHQSAAPSPTGTTDPNTSASPSTSVPPSNAPVTPPASQTATGIAKLSTTDVTLDSYGQFFTLRAVLSPADSTGTVTYTSQNPTVASVDETGKVTGLSRGNTTITVTLPGADPKTCIVRCSFDAPAGANTSANPSTPPDGTATTPGTFKLNREDFTLPIGDTFKMKVSGTTAAATWSIDKTSVATISADGTVTAVSKGNATITCTVDGKTATCIVRCK